MNRYASLAKAAIPVFMAISMSAPSRANTTISGHIMSTFSSSPGNYSFRIYLDTQTPGCTDSFLYTNSADGNYNTYVASLISAYYGGRSVLVTYAPDSGGFCHIIEFGS